MCITCLRRNRQGADDTLPYGHTSTNYNLPGFDFYYSMLYFFTVEVIREHLLSTYFRRTDFILIYLIIDYFIYLLCFFSD